VSLDVVVALLVVELDPHLDLPVFVDSVLNFVLTDSVLRAVTEEQH